MASLLIFKIIVPIALVSFAVGLVTRISRVPTFAIFFLVVAMSAVLSLNFFFLVRNDGSWKDIGNSIRCVGHLLRALTD